MAVDTAVQARLARVGYENGNGGTGMNTAERVFLVERLVYMCHLQEYAIAAENEEIAKLVAHQGKLVSDAVLGYSTKGGHILSVKRVTTK